jgi:hypothetical protein
MTDSMHKPANTLKSKKCMSPTVSLMKTYRKRAVSLSAELSRVKEERDRLRGALIVVLARIDDTDLTYEQAYETLKHGPWDLCCAALTSTAKKEETK